MYVGTAAGDIWPVCRVGRCVWSDFTSSSYKGKTKNIKEMLPWGSNGEEAISSLVMFKEARKKHSEETPREEVLTAEDEEAVAAAI